MKPLPALSRWLSGLFLTLVLQGCSWVEQFAIFNLKTDAVIVGYTLNTDIKGVAIFESGPVCYRVTEEGNIDWEQAVVLEDGNPAPDIVLVEVPPKCVLIFGYLHNDTYERYNQEFINDRKFNLKLLFIGNDKTGIQITPATFDAHFQKKKGVIKYIIQ